MGIVEIPCRDSHLKLRLQCLVDFLVEGPGRVKDNAHSRQAAKSLCPPTPHELC